MATAAKVFIIIAMAFNVLGFCIIVGLFAEFIPPILILFLLIEAVISLIVGFKALGQLNDFGEASVLMSVLTLIFCSLIAGIIMLCIPRSSSRRHNGITLGGQCDKCGVIDADVRQYSLNTYLGVTTRFLCPKCKDELNQEKKSSTSAGANQCENCYAVNDTVKQYNFNTPTGIITKTLCEKCKSQYDK